MIVHPRAAHGPGIGGFEPIGGFKADSEIGAPLSCRADVERENPMRQTGGVLGGSWLRALDLDAGKFDGGYPGSNFESLNPANTFWTKPGSPGPWGLRTAQNRSSTNLKG